MRHLSRWFCALLTALLLAACASAPKDHFYTLSNAPSASDAKPAAAQTRYGVAVGPVKVPEIVDRPQFVIREGDNRVALMEQHRWAQPLRSEIARALAADLARQLPQAQVSFHNDSAARNADCRVLMDIERFDAILGGAVTVQGLWTVRCAEPAAARMGRATVTEPAPGGGYDDLAAAYGRALAAISVEIANAVSLLQPAGGK